MTLCIVTFENEYKHYANLSDEIEISLGTAGSILRQHVDHHQLYCYHKNLLLIYYDKDYYI